MVLLDRCQTHAARSWKSGSEGKATSRLSIPTSRFDLRLADELLIERWHRLGACTLRGRRDQASFWRKPSINAQGERDAGLAGHQAPGLVGCELELTILRRAARELEGDLVLARRQIDFLAVGRLRSGYGVVGQPGLGRQLDRLPVDGDDGRFIRGIAEQQPDLARHRLDG